KRAVRYPKMIVPINPWPYETRPMELAAAVDQPKPRPGCGKSPNSSANGTSRRIGSKPYHGLESKAVQNSPRIVSYTTRKRAEPAKIISVRLEARCTSYMTL